MVEVINKEVKLFYDSNSKAPFVSWLEKLDNITRRIIENRMVRLSFGNYMETIKE